MYVSHLYSTMVVMLKFLPSLLPNNELSPGNKSPSNPVSPEWPAVKVFYNNNRKETRINVSSVNLLSIYLPSLRTVYSFHLSIYRLDYLSLCACFFISLYIMDVSLVGSLASKDILPLFKVPSHSANGFCFCAEAFKFHVISPISSQYDNHIHY